MGVLKIKTKVSIKSKYINRKQNKKLSFPGNLEKTIIKRNFPGNDDKIEQKDTHFLKYTIKYMDWNPQVISIKHIRLTYFKIILKS